MRRQNLLFSALLCATLVGCGGGSNSSSTQPKEKLIVGLECNYAPFNWTENTKTAVMILQRFYTYKGDGTLDDGTVSIITDLINSYKTYTYYEDSQFDIALIYHSSKSQAKRLFKEKEALRIEQQKLIEENEAYYDSLED